MISLAMKYVDINSVDFLQCFRYAIRSDIATFSGFRKMTSDESKIKACFISRVLHVEYCNEYNIFGAVPIVAIDPSIDLGFLGHGYVAQFQVSIPTEHIDDYEKYFFHTKLTYEKQKEE